MESTTFESIIVASFTIGEETALERSAYDAYRKWNSPLRRAFRDAKRNATIALTGKVSHS